MTLLKINRFPLGLVYPSKPLSLACAAEISQMQSEPCPMLPLLFPLVRITSNTTTFQYFRMLFHDFFWLRFFQNRSTIPSIHFTLSTMKLEI